MIFECLGRISELKYKMVTDSVVEITEDIQDNKISTYSRLHLNWFNIYSSEMLFYLYGYDYDEVNIDKSTRPFSVYIFNSQKMRNRNYIGDWDGKHIKWYNKIYLPDK
jgi:hypothetical protein